jgi:ABC-2 type transport system permease protein
MAVPAPSAQPFCISSALFSVAHLQAWLTFLNRIDPLTYAVDPMKKVVFSNIKVPPEARHVLDPGVTWFGWRVPTLVAVGRRRVLGLLMLGVAIWEFSATE